jgi:peroxiredoxin
MPRPAIGDQFPSARLDDIDGATVDLPKIFSRAPATVIFFYRGRW